VRAKLLTWLDRLLSDPLRQAAPSELVRHRLLVGAASFMTLCSLLLILIAPLSAFTVFQLLCGLGYLSTLVLARRATSVRAPAALLCGIMGLATTAMPLLTPPLPSVSMHAGQMLLPALAVYLLGVRPGLLITLVLCGVLGVLHPLYLIHVAGSSILSQEPYYLQMQGLAVISLLGAWGLGSLHSTARAEVQASLEQTLEKLHSSEGKLFSLIESTDDVICSLDTQGHLLTANSAMRRAYHHIVGKEPVVGQPLFAQTAPELLEQWGPRLAQVLSGQRLQFEEDYDLGPLRLTVDVRVCPILGQDGRVTGLTLFSRDITPRKQAEAKLGEVYRTLVDVSRQAGMAEVATGVLHNVGNTLNSVNISAGLISEKLRGLHVSGLSQAVDMLEEHAADLGSFLSSDAKGRQLPAYLRAVSQRLSREQEALLTEMQSLSEGIDHIKSVVNMQQKHARTVGTVEVLPVPQIIDEALRLHAVSFERMGIPIEREFANVPPVSVDRHKLMQILVNLLSNARHALAASSRPDKRLTLRVRTSEEGKHLRIEVSDNGQGISPEHLPLIFSQGFTTRKEGHGFGLHISALAAAEMKGRLSCTSAGAGQGATFTLELPLAASEET
jgi:PAS domain S-box-containing protein